MSAPYVAPLWPASHLPRKGGDHSRRSRHSSCSVADWRNQSGRLISPLAGEMAGRPEGGAKGTYPTTPQREDSRRRLHQISYCSERMPHSVAVQLRLLIKVEEKAKSSPGNRGGLKHRYRNDEAVCRDCRAFRYERGRNRCERGQSGRRAP